MTPLTCLFIHLCTHTHTHVCGCRYRLYGVLLREPTDFHDVNEPGKCRGLLSTSARCLSGSSKGKWLQQVQPSLGIDRCAGECVLGVSFMQGRAGVLRATPIAAGAVTPGCPLCPPYVCAGQLISRLTSDCYAITRCIATNVNVALRNLLQVIGEHNRTGTQSQHCPWCSCLTAAGL